MKNIIGWVGAALLILVVCFIAFAMLNDSPEKKEAKKKEKIAEHTKELAKLGVTVSPTAPVVPAPAADENKPSSAQARHQGLGPQDIDEINSAFAERVHVQDPQRSQIWDDNRKVWVNQVSREIFITSPNLYVFDFKLRIWTAPFDAFARRYPARGEALRAQYPSRQPVYLDEAGMIARYGSQANPRQ